MRWGHEDGYFILDALGALILLVAMTAGMSYIHVQLAGIKELEGYVTAECMVREQLDRLCVEEQESALGIRYRQENGYEFCIESTREDSGNQGLVRYRVQADWQAGEKRHSFALSKEAQVEG